MNSIPTHLHLYLIEGGIYVFSPFISSLQASPHGEATCSNDMQQASTGAARSVRECERMTHVHPASYAIPRTGSGLHRWSGQVCLNYARAARCGDLPHRRRRSAAQPTYRAGRGASPVQVQLSLPRRRHQRGQMVDWAAPRTGMGMWLRGNAAQAELVREASSFAEAHPPRSPSVSPDKRRH